MTIVVRFLPKTYLRTALYFVVALTLVACAPLSASAQRYNTLYDFCSPSSCPDGKEPQSTLLRDAAGNLYGTTTDGGGYGYGALVKFISTGEELNPIREVVLHRFCSEAGCVDGAYPVGGVISDSAGNLYGTTAAGGTHAAGTIFKWDNTTGEEEVLYSFGASPGDGTTPDAGLIRDSAGNLYGTTLNGGIAVSDFPMGGGTVFKLDSEGIQTLLYGFCSVSNAGAVCSDGATWPSCPPATAASTPSPPTPPTSSSTSPATSPRNGRSSCRGLWRALVLYWRRISPNQHYRNSEQINARLQTAVGHFR